MTMIKTSKPFKQRDIQPCACCKQGLMHKDNPLGMFWRLDLERMMIDHGAGSRQHGLELMMGGNAGIARAMGPDQDMAQPVTEEFEVLICEHCVMHQPMVALFQIAEDQIKQLETKQVDLSVADERLPFGRRLA